MEKPLKPIEKYFLLHAERGDCVTVRRLIKQYQEKPEELNINCVDPLNRSALVAAIENENIELIKILLEAGIDVKDALLHAIKEEYVEAVELLLDWEEQHHQFDGQKNWENEEIESSLFATDITPLMLAAQKNNFEITKLLLDRGAKLPIPHDVKCGCDNCVKLSQIDSLRHSKARINAYQALTSPSLIALSSKDPVLTAFHLSKELKRLSRLETEFSTEYKDMRQRVQNFATALLDYARSSYELEIILNYNPDGDNWIPGERHSLERLRLAIKYEQKVFVAHPNVQQLLASIWYEGVPGFKRKKLFKQFIDVSKLALMFPIFSIVYIIAPNAKIGKFIMKPFIKFICYSASYTIFLILVGTASQRGELLLLEKIKIDWVQDVVKEWNKRERGSFFGVAECGVIIYVISFIWQEVRNLWTNGIYEHVSDLWNVIDFIINLFYITWIGLRMSSWYIVMREADQGENPWYPREEWHDFDPMLLSEGAFATGMIFSYLKLVHIFSINPHLGPLQISLGRMIIDIVKFFFIYTLVLFAFACGLNQLLWYYAELERDKCFLENGTQDLEDNEKACSVWRRYSNLFETSQSLFWAMFGLVDLFSFELTGIKGFTRFWALLMFGSYSVINVIVLLNMLIAMMSNSYQLISEHSDIEWKFARSRLWINYFDDCDTLPPPFNIFPTPKLLIRLFKCKKCPKDQSSLKKISPEKAQERHEAVMRLLIKRYIVTEQQKRDVSGVTEDDVMEIRQDISSLRYQLINILKRNGMNTPQISEEDCQVSSKKEKIMQRRILKNFNIGTVDAVVSEIVHYSSSRHKFNQIAREIKRKLSLNKTKNWKLPIKRTTSDSYSVTKARDENRFLKNIQKRLLNIKQSAIDFRYSLPESNESFSENNHNESVDKNVPEKSTEEEEAKVIIASDDSLSSCNQHTNVITQQEEFYQFADVKVNDDTRELDRDPHNLETMEAKSKIFINIENK